MPVTKGVPSFDETIDEISSNVSSEDEQKVRNEIPGKIASLEGKGGHGISLLIEQVKIAYAMITDKHYQTKWATKAMLIAGLIYFLLPTDLTPDFIPLIGYIDDAAVLTAIFRTLAKEIQRYRDYIA